MTADRVVPLVFDDGSRVMMREEAPTEALPAKSPRGSASISDYYEIDRLVAELMNNSNHADHLRVALQFPDALLPDAPDVLWEFERLLPSNALVFILGDSTFAPCCPDAIAAAHLQADWLIHYGHACLSPTNIPVLYSFGRASMDVDVCLSNILRQCQASATQRLLLLYDVSYHHAMEELQTRLSEQGELLVVAGQIPHQQQSASNTTVRTCCGPDENCCGSDHPKNNEHAAVEEQTTDDAINQYVVGGLVLPHDVDWSSYTLLYVGDTDNRQFLNLVLQFLSVIPFIWTYSPSNNNALATELSPSFQKVLNRRYYLVQKARQASVFGILVANFSHLRIRAVTASVRRLLESHHCTSYTFVVGKINPAKLSNFAEIQCYVLVACPEQSLLLDHDREFPVPVLTPLELSMALGVTEWGHYSMDPNEYLQVVTTHASTRSTEIDDDAPYFSLITGRYESKPSPIDLSTTPGQGQLTTYTSSVAAEFLKQREFQGLQLDPESAPVEAAVPGQQGIASNYGER